MEMWPDTLRCGRIPSDLAGYPQIVAGYPQDEGIRPLAGYTQLAKNGDRDIPYNAFCVFCISQRNYRRVARNDAVSLQRSEQSILDT